MHAPSRSRRTRPAPPSLDALMAQHDGLVHTVLRRQWGGPLSYAERLQAGRIGLWHALRGYDPTRGTAFSTYAGVAIARQVWRAVRTAPPPSPWLPPPDPPDPAAVLLQHEAIATLHALVQQLPLPLRTVVIATYGLDGNPPRSLRQLGRIWGVSHETVRLRRWAALVWLRQPDHSRTLRVLLDRTTTADYADADTLAHRWLRRRGGRHADDA